MIRARSALLASALAVIAIPVAWRVGLDHGAEPPAPPRPAEVAPPQPAPVPPEAVEAPKTGPQTVLSKPAAPLPQPAPAPAAPMPGGTAAAGKVVTDSAAATRSAAQRQAARSLDEMARAAASQPQATRSALAPKVGAPMIGAPLYESPSPRMRQLSLAPEPMDRASEPVGRDTFAGAVEDGFRTTQEAPVSTFSIDVDTASYSFLRASLARNVLPPKAAIRTEELVNYFPYAYEGPASAAEPFKITTAIYPSPWAEGRKIIQVGIKGYAVAPATRPRANLVFLIDTSGSMDAPNRLPLVKQALAMLLTQLDARDRVAIVTYAGSAGVALEPTPASDAARILRVIEGLNAGGGTAGGEGIRQAYSLAERNRDPEGVNRVVLATDGDFNLGITNREELQGFVERERGKGVFLSVLGFGMGNYNDALMQTLAQNGNGAAAYIDTLNEARKVLVEEATSTLIPIAKDVKIQVEFNPAAIAEYRLIGYETRRLAREDFANDAVDAGEVGSGQSVTALYEVVPAGGPRLTGDLRYGAKPDSRSAGPAPAPQGAGEYAHVAIRYKLPNGQANGQVSALIETPVDRSREQARFEEAPQEARFATAVAAFGQLLRGSKYIGAFGFDDVVRIGTAARGEDAFGYRAEFLQIVRAAKTAQALTPLRP